MRTSEAGINLIKQFEGCRLKAYKPVAAEKYYTIGWGHYGADVTANMTISQQQADEILVADLKKFEKAVTKTGLELNQNQFDALVSFTYNCGAGNLQKLVKNRTHSQIADAMLLYNKGANKQVLSGLMRRRELERALFLSDDMNEIEIRIKEPTAVLKRGSKGVGVKWVQAKLNSHGYNLAVDGIFGAGTEFAVIKFQKSHGLTPDGIVGKLTRAELQK